VSNPPIRCLDCGQTWTGLRREHCPVCCQTFNSSFPGDMHRVGKHGVTVGADRRRCLTAAEMHDKGMCEHDGVWYGPDGGRGNPWGTSGGSDLSAAGDVGVPGPRVPAEDAPDSRRAA
jgi:hypothetical protein